MKIPIQHKNSHLPGYLIAINTVEDSLSKCAISYGMVMWEDSTITQEWIGYLLVKGEDQHG